MNDSKYKPTLCVGADIHLDKIVLRAVDKALGHEVLQRFRVTNNLPGAQHAATTIAQTASDLDYACIEIGWESTGMLWIPFHRYLSTEPILQPFELELVCFNPKLVAKFKDGLVLRSPKNDDRDAFDIAARLRFGELPLSYMPSDFWQGLRRLTRYRFRLSKALSQEKNRFSSYAFLKCSDWKRVKAFSDLFGATSIALLTEFTVAEVHEMTHDQLVDLIARRGRGRFDDPTATARAVRQALLTSYPITSQMDEMVTAALAAAWDHIRYLKRSMKRLDRLIARYIDSVPNPIITIKGLGAVITAGILAEIVDILRFPDEKHLAQFMGLTWRKQASGAFVSQNTRLTKVGNLYLRYYFVLGANLLRQHNLEYKAYYWRKYQEVPKYQHKRALVLTARKLVRLVHALLTKNQPYVRPQTSVRDQEDDGLQ
jgi:transposase